MNRKDLNKMYDFADTLRFKEEKEDKENYIYKHYVEIKRLLEVIKKENPDGFWYYSDNFEESALYFLNMLAPYCDLVEKSYKIKKWDRYPFYILKPTCSIEEIDKALDNYRHDKHIYTFYGKYGILSAIKNQIPYIYFGQQAINMAHYLVGKSLVEKYLSGTSEEEERVIYYIK